MSVTVPYLHLKAAVQTAVAAATAGYCVEQQTLISGSIKRQYSPPPSPLAELPLSPMAVRSGVEIRHSGTVVILGSIQVV